MLQGKPQRPQRKKKRGMIGRKEFLRYGMIFLII
jgi:hypothetical protein